MINVHDILETIKMIDEEYLDVRTITMGISLLDCCDSDIDKSCEKIYNKITRLAKNLVKTGEDIEREYGIPIINKRISVTPIAMLVAVSGGDPVKYAHTLERCAQAVGVNFIGGYSALVQKGCAAGDRELMESIPRALAETEHVCASVNVGSTKAGINMNAVELMGRMVKEAAELTKDRNCIGAAKLVVFCNAPEDNPFMAPTPAIGDSVAYILEEMGLESCGAYGTTACLAMLNDAVKKGGVMASSTVGGLSGAFIPVSEDAGMIAATRAGTLCLEKLEAMTAVCSVGLVNSKTTAVRAIPAIGKKVGEELEFGGLLGSGPVMNINQTDCSVMIHRKGRIPAPIQALKN